MAIETEREERPEETENSIAVESAGEGALAPATLDAEAAIADRKTQDGARGHALDRLARDRTVDHSARGRALDTSRSFLVQAPAGSGKTELLTLRFLELLAIANDPHEILAITFTRAATAEMRKRVADALEEAARDSAKNDEPAPLLSRRVQAARAALKNDRAHGWNLLEQPHQLNIQTIDSLCLTIAHETPLLSRLGGSLQPLEDAGALYALAARRTLARMGGSAQKLSAAIRSLLDLRETSMADCERLIAGMLQRRDQWGEVLPLLARANNNDFDWNGVRTLLETPFIKEQERVMAGARAFFSQRLPEFHQLLQLAGDACQNLESEGRPPRWQLLSRIGALEDLAEKSHWDCLCEFLLTGTNGWRKRLDSAHGFPSGRSGLAAKDRFRSLVEGFSEDGDLLEILCELRKLPPARYTDAQWLLLEHILEILRYAAAELRVVFAERKVVDFVELGLAAREVLRDENGEPSAIADRLSQRWPHLLVDEFQDTSRAQYELLTLLTAGRDRGERSTIFLVGDPMQSIYGFRQAEVELFAATRKRGLGGEAGAQTLEALDLKMNFRAHAGIVDPLNGFFESIFSRSEGRGYQVRFSRSVAGKPAAESRYPSVRVVKQFLTSDEEKDALGEAEAKEVLEIIKAHSGEMDSARRKGLPFRIAVLARARNHLTEIVRQLREADIPFRAVEIEDLSKVQEVLDLKALASALMQPMNRIAWLSVLRAPWCGLTMSDLHLLCGSDDPAFAQRPVLELLRSRISLLSADGQRRAQRVTGAFEEALRRKHRQVSFSRWVERLWWTLGGPDCVDPAGYENARTFFRILEELPPGASLERKLELIFAKPDPRTSERNGLQLMTIHKAKGLEFEIVIVPGLERQTRSDNQPLLSWLERIRLDPSEEHEEHELLVAPIGRKGEDTDPLYRWIERQREQREAEEAKRLLYVAATRAIGELHLIGTAAVKTKPGGISSVEAGAKSLLTTAWPAIGELFEKEWEEKWQNRNRATGRPAENPAIRNTDLGSSTRDSSMNDGDRSTKTLLLRRLPSDWNLAAAGDEAQLELRFASTLAGQPEEIQSASIGPGEMESREEAASPALRPSASLETRAAGVAAHALFEEAARRSGKRPEELLHEIASWRPRAMAMLRHEGLAKAEAEQRSGIVIQALRSALEDETGRWILRGRSKAQTENSWSAWIETGRSKELSTVRPDRIFRAGAEPGSEGESHLWIVDYKTARTDENPVEPFLERQKDLYRPQLAAYAGVVRRMYGESLELRLALYYPLLKRLIWWAG